jgi:hypothetical protein
MERNTTRAQFLDCLNHNWQPYIERFNRLSAEEKAAFLHKQGYRTLADLLAHIISWWQDAVPLIQRMRKDSTLPLPEYDVDEFNARAVAQFSNMSEAEVIEVYTTQCKTMIELVRELPESELLQKNINTRLYYEIIMHWTEHPLE